MRIFDGSMESLGLVHSPELLQLRIQSTGDRIASRALSDVEGLQPRVSNTDDSIGIINGISPQHGFDILDISTADTPMGQNLVLGAAGIYLSPSHPISSIGPRIESSVCPDPDSST